MGASANCSKCTLASGGANAAGRGEEQEPGEPMLQPRVNMYVKFGGFAAGDLVAENRGELADFYDVHKDVLLGEGSSSSVYRCTNKQTQQQRAVKIIGRKLLRSNAQAEEEIRILRLLDHPNIVRIYETFEDSRSVYLVLDLCDGGELFDQVVDSAPFDERPSALCFRQMLRAVSYLHKNHIVHRDLKAENWLLATALPLEKASIKLADFGTAKRLDPGSYAATKCGTPYYVSPEVIAGRYNEKADIWSLGIVLHMLITGIPPFGGNNTQEVLNNVKSATRVHVDRLPKSVSTEGKQMLATCLDIDPDKRLSAAEGIKHAWIVKTLKDEPDNRASIGPSLQLMKDYSKTGKLEKLSLAAVASQLSREAIADLEQAFIAMDTNGDGTLSLDELGKGLAHSGVKMNRDELKQMLDQIDTDGSGAIDYSEFIAATMDQTKYLKENACYKAFKMFDLDGSGFIDRAELSKLIKSEAVAKSFGPTSTDGVDSALQELDLNSDGKLDFDEFMAMLYHLDRASCSVVYPKCSVIGSPS